ncbi:DUF3352 domain-containing protein [Pedococcus sp. KACC 23699]|uniref:DUF3352 domain-containing protein n=1 Tax=Pedococcus sp. KACC 23699 TaxID=3149228 RepID=A0AAU7JYB9_9MICO
MAPAVELRGAGAEELVALMQANGRDRRRGRVVALVGAVTGIVVLGTGGIFAFQQLSGSGPQPESVLPSSTVAFAKVDLDPSAGQKVDAFRFLRSFPAADKQIGADTDLRKVAFEAIQQQGGLGKVDYAKDVQPWLGQRMGIGFVPDTAAKEGARPVLALGISDATAARTHLPALASSLGGRCRVLEEYAVCTSGTTDAPLDAIVAATARGTLAEASTYRQDMRDLGEDGVVSAWVDSAKAGEMVSALGGAAGMPKANLTNLADAGRTAVALRFDGPNLELAGHVNGVKARPSATGDVRTITTLPWNTLAAVSVGGAGKSFSAAWPELESSLRAAVGDKEFTAGLKQVEQAVGISVPGDVAAALGTRFTVVFGGIDPTSGPKVAVLGDGDADVLRTVADHAAGLAGGGQAFVRPAGGGTVVSLSDDYGQEVATTHGLGDMPAFKDALKDPQDAQVAAYVDISGLAAQFKDDVAGSKSAPAGASAGASALDHLSALGITATGHGSDADFRIRLTTK